MMMMMPAPSRLFLILALLVALPCAALAAPVDKVMCVFDPSGQHGDLFRFGRDYQAAALGFGVRLQLKAYTNEVVATNDFKAGQCHAVLLTSLRARAFVKATGTLEAIGALPDYALLKSAIRVLANPKLERLVKQGAHETVAIIPGGAVYLMLRNRAHNSMAKLAGKRIAALIHDKPSRIMVDVVGASVVPAEVGTFAGIFNNGRADACYAPATAVKPLELQKGMERGGGVVRYALGQLTFQIIARTADLPAGFGAKSRKWGAEQFDNGLKMARKAEAAIPKRLWIDIPAADKAIYDAKLREVRIKLRGQGIYHPGVLKLMRKIRCKAAPKAGECTNPTE